jgi:hypothetical protein
MVIQDVDPSSVTESGWGIITAKGTPPPPELSVLIEHRRSQAGDLYRELVYEPRETAWHFLQRHNIVPGVVDPAEGVPYYLLIAAGFEAVPYAFQRDLSLLYAVGRLYFSDASGYGRYAEAVDQRRKSSEFARVTIFATSHPHDRLSATLASSIASPIERRLKRRGFNVEIIQQNATRSTLIDLLRRNAAPTVLLTSTHGILLNPGDPRWQSEQGALLCQDWPGPNLGSGPIPREFYFAGADVPDDAQVAGAVMVHASSYSAGAVVDDFAWRGNEAQSNPPMISALAQNLLSHRNGAAGAVIGTLGPCVFLSDPARTSTTQTNAYYDAVRRIAQGERVGHVYETAFSSRYAAAAALLENSRNEPAAAAEAWVTVNNFRTQIVLGDPAMRVVATVS